MQSVKCTCMHVGCFVYVFGGNLVQGIDVVLVLVLIFLCLFFTLFGVLVC